jgi:signal transduction histidine kinase
MAGGWLDSLIGRVARVRASVHAKLRLGFLTGAVLLLAMAGLSVAVLGHMADRVAEINQAQAQVDRLRQMQYLVTAQSHYRAMALLTQDQNNLSSLATAKAQFLAFEDAVERDSLHSQRGLLSRVRAANERFSESSDRVLELQRQGAHDRAMQLHLQEEHPISHEIEGAMAALLESAVGQMDVAQQTFESDQRLLTWLVVAFSIVSLALALLLGYVLSWSFLRPLYAIQHALSHLAAGRFDEPIAVPNRDEFGALGRDTDATRRELAQLYGELETLNAQLRGTNMELLGQLQEQVIELARSRGLITEAEERLRREIAEVLHSRVQNRLLMVWYRLEECQDLLERDPAEAERLIGQIREQVDEIREHDVRELSHRLHPSIIRAGIAAALETLVEELPHLPVRLSIDPAVEALDQSIDHPLPDAVRLTAYRVVEEALANVARHAGAARVAVTVGLVEGYLVVEVRDDGRGFDTATSRTGLGLGSIAARVDRIGGAWTVTSRTGEGTLLAVRLPRSVDKAQNGFDAEVPLRQERDAETHGGRAITPIV